MDDFDHKRVSWYQSLAVSPRLAHIYNDLVSVTVMLPRDLRTSPVFTGEVTTATLREGVDFKTFLLHKSDAEKIKMWEKRETAADLEYQSMCQQLQHQAMMEMQRQLMQPSKVQIQVAEIRQQANESSWEEYHKWADEQKKEASRKFHEKWDRHQNNLVEDQEKQLYWWLAIVGLGIPVAVANLVHFWIPLIFG